MQNQKWRAAGMLLALAVAFGIGLYSGIEERISNIAAAASTSVPSFTINLNQASQPQNVDMAQFWQAWSLLNQNFVETHASGTIPSDQDKIYGAIAGLTDSYGDPYTVFMKPQQAQQFTENISGSFGGVGMEMGTDKNGDIVVVAPLKDSPAQAAGIQSGDAIWAINGTSTAGMMLEEAVSLIRGPIGTKVVLTVLHQGAQKPVDISIVRDTIHIPEIDTKARGDGIFVIQLYTFSANSADLFRNALRDFFQTGDTKLVLDLRGNPGGYLDAAVQMASYFLPVGQTVVTEDFEGTADNIVHRSLGYNVFANKTLNMAILVDQGSASASEILAGALEQHGVAKLVGTRTFGKGSVQELFDLGGGAQIKITVARWLTPNGTNISDGGLTPDINATTTPDDVKAGKDPTMDAAAAWLATQ